jgi:hypothetical protein
MRRYARIPLVAWLAAAVALVVGVTLAGWMMLGRGGVAPEDSESEVDEISMPAEPTVSKPATKTTAKPNAKPAPTPNEQPPAARPGPPKRPRPPGRTQKPDEKSGPSPLDNLDALRPGDAGANADAPAPDTK